MTAGTAEVVITTKLFRPGLRQQTVERKRLHDLLREGRTLPLTLVVAPAGWGKSTIVADWLARDDVTAGWVSLDGGDNDPKRFWRYLLLAAGQAGSAAGPAALRRLDAGRLDVLRDVLPAFVNELASAQAPLVLVLDDYHLVTSAQVHATVATLLDRCPPQLHLMLITRADPPLPLSRLRVRGDLAELRAEDLRFSAGEAVEFFSSRLGVGPPLSEHDVLRLLARTEGWAAGLQLAALRLRDRPDRSDFIERLTGADWHIVNYLGEEVLATQPAEVREFLLATSVLNRMCAPLCDALTERADGARADQRDLPRQPVPGPAGRRAPVVPVSPPVRRPAPARAGPDGAGSPDRSCTGGPRNGMPTTATPPRRSATRSPRATKRLAADWWRRTGVSRSTPGSSRRCACTGSTPCRQEAAQFATDASLSAARVWVALDTGEGRGGRRRAYDAETSVPPDTQLMVLRALQLYKAGDVGGAAARLGDLAECR